MAGEFGIVLPPWNYSDREDSLLSRVIGEVGIEHITVPVITGPRSQFCLFGPRESPYFHTEGGWHYPAEARLYTLSGVRPRPARWFAQRDVLRKICEQARTAGLDVNVRIDLPALTALCEQSPAISQRNAWGDSYSDWGPCLSSPGFRALLEAAVEDLLRYKPDGFQLVNNRIDSLSFELASSTFDRPIGPGFEICFCASCRQIAADHVDVEQAARSVRAHVENFCSALRPGVTSDDLLKGLQSDEALLRYLAIREHAVERWLESLAARHPEHQFFHGPVTYDSAHIGAHGLVGFKRIEIFDAEAFLSSESSSDNAEAPSARSMDPESRTGPRVGEALEMGVWFSWEQGSDSLVRAVSHALERGVTFFDFAELDETPPETVNWLRQAIRYARRQ